MLGTRLATQFSNNIRNDFGFLNRCAPERATARQAVFRQHGRKVFREVCPMVAELIRDHLASSASRRTEIRRIWLHQANLDDEPVDRAKRSSAATRRPRRRRSILDEFANTSSAGSVIAFHRQRSDLAPGDLGVICSFGAGYSIGSVVVRKLARA